MHFDQLRVVSALPPDGGWRADLAVDRSASPPRAVLVARVPPAVAGDALALSRLARGLDLAGRIEHPSLRRLLGTGEVDGDLVLVEAWREGATLRTLLDAGGPLTEELAARVAVDVAGALQAAHAASGSPGRPLCHGAVSAELVLLGEDGQVMLCGLGRPISESVSPEDDLRGLARLLLECLPPTGGEGPGPLQAACDRVLAGEGYPSATAFAEAIVAAAAPADTATVLARLEASQPEGMPAWLARRRALAQALRAEGGAAAHEVAHADEPGQSAPVAAEAPAPAHTPPPLPPGGNAVTPASAESAVVAPAVEAAALPAAPVAGHAEWPVEVAGAGPPRRVAPLFGVPVSDFEAWLQHPQTPVAVGAALGLLGFALGFVMGGR